VWFINLGDALGVLKLNVAVLVDRGVELLDLLVEISDLHGAVLARVHALLLDGGLGSPPVEQLINISVWECILQHGQFLL